jgi:hypothetical protein
MMIVTRTSAVPVKSKLTKWTFIAARKTCTGWPFIITP